MDGSAKIILDVIIPYSHTLFEFIDIKRNLLIFLNNYMNLKQKILMDLIRVANGFDNEESYLVDFIIKKHSEEQQEDIEVPFEQKPWNKHVWEISPEDIDDIPDKPKDPHQIKVQKFISNKILRETGDDPEILKLVYMSARDRKGYFLSLSEEDQKEFFIKLTDSKQFGLSGHAAAYIIGAPVNGVNRKIKELKKLDSEYDTTLGERGEVKNFQCKIKGCGKTDPKDFYYDKDKGEHDKQICKECKNKARMAVQRSKATFKLDFLADHLNFGKRECFYCGEERTVTLQVNHIDPDKKVTQISRKQLLSDIKDQKKLTQKQLTMAATQIDVPADELQTYIDSMRPEERYNLVKQIVSWQTSRGHSEENLIKQLSENCEILCANCHSGYTTGILVRKDNELVLSGKVRESNETRESALNFLKAKYGVSCTGNSHSYSKELFDSMIDVHHYKPGKADDFKSIWRGGKRWPMERVFKEMELCKPLCKNCHFIEHAVGGDD